MKAIVAFCFLLLAFSSLQAASLKNLSEKLTLPDKSEEKLFNQQQQHHRNVNEDEDETVAELDHLKNHNHEDMNNEINVDDSLESSLKNLHHKQKNVEIVRRPTESSTTPRQKEVIEILPLPDTNEATTISNPTADKIGQTTRLMQKDLPLTPENILRHVNGKYSAYDMAQYVFWTGDEEGVARAVEELIDNGLMSRENALEFLSDIRLGIDYLESTYNSDSSSKSSTKPTESTSSYEIPSNYGLKYQKFHSFFNSPKENKENESPTLSPIAFKALEKLPSLLKLTEAHKALNKQQQLDENLDSSPFDDENGRSRVADYVYGEYSLEEVIYQLAKSMFTQSLTRGSEESQVALQKLTEFLEREGKHGKISANLQKKILDVLLAALSDTLSENPEIMEKVRHAVKIK